jgi:hypothetical protein
MALSISLAVVEDLVHLPKEDFPAGYVAVSAFIPDELRILTKDELLKDFPNVGSRELGDRWIDSLASPVLRVHFEVIPEEFNFLLNPSHTAFAQIVAEPAMASVRSDVRKRHDPAGTLEMC